MRVSYGTAYVSREDVKKESLYKRDTSMHFSDLKMEIQRSCNNYNTVWYQIKNKHSEVRPIVIAFKEKGCIKPNKFRKTKPRKLIINKKKNGNTSNV